MPISGGKNGRAGQNPKSCAKMAKTDATKLIGVMLDVGEGEEGGGGGGAALPPPAEP